MDPKKKEIFKLTIDRRFDELIRIVPSLSGEQRRTALQQLSDAAPEEAVEVFSYAAKNDEDLMCRVHAIHGLKKIGGEQAERGLLDALKTEREPGVACQILIGIEKIGTPLSIPDLAVPAQSDDRHVRYKTVLALLAIGTNSETERILLGLLNDSDRIIRFLVMADLIKHGSPQAKEAASRQLENEGFVTRKFLGRYRRAMGQPTKTAE
jgi:HEAT repeat protein